MKIKLSFLTPPPPECSWVAKMLLVREDVILFVVLSGFVNIKEMLLHTFVGMYIRRRELPTKSTKIAPPRTTMITQYSLFTLYLSYLPYLKKVVSGKTNQKCLNK